MRVIALSNQKGGVGKTTTVVNLGAALARARKRVLLLDADPQAHLSISLGCPDATPCLYDVLTGRAGAKDVIRSMGGRLDLLPADITLARADMELAGQPGRDFILRDAIEGLNGEHDYILIDCPPSLGLMTLNALTAAHEVIIPLQAEYLPLRGIGQLIEAIDLVRKRTNPALYISGVLFTRWQKRKVLSRETEAQAKAYFGAAVMDTRIRECVALAEAPGNAQNIFQYSPKSHGAEDYRALAREVIKERRE